jgi:hypothetical protein
MPAAILWGTVVAWFLLVGIGVTELVRSWRKARQTIESR